MPSSPPPAATTGPRWLRFSEIAGQREAIWRVQAAAAAGRLHHALLLDGPAGCGKTSLAVALAAALSCRSRPAPTAPAPLDAVLQAPEPLSWPLDACGSCPSCRKMPDHPDLLRLSVEEGKTRIAIEQVRDVAAEMAYPPHESPCRTVIVRQADRLSPEAANALLKTLEEPTRGNLVVLTTSRPAFLLPTIRSRCVRVPLRPLPPGTLRRLLARTFPDASDASLDLAAGLSAGGMSRAKEILAGDPGAAMTAMGDFGRAVDTGDLAGLLAAVEALGPDRDRAAADLDLLLVLLRDRLASAAGQSTLLGTTASSAVAAFARHPPEAVAVEGGLVSEARRNLEANANPQLTLEWLATACARAVARARRGSSPDG
ncbi:MAG: AAA family ATPase [Deltaproteobacteria bacterium]|nr:AAA family ATPase [Deltaproteobacteria bacterium]